MGCDPCVLLIIHIITVSIHAPAWGATVALFLIPSHLLFQSTHPHGVRRTSWPRVEAVYGFNPRTRMGCDQGYQVLYGFCYCFNLRTRMGCDANWIELFKLIWVSIHAPAWGATAESVIADGVIGVSIHAPAWGATIV